MRRGEGRERIVRMSACFSSVPSLSFHAARTCTLLRQPRVKKAAIFTYSMLKLSRIIRIFFNCGGVAINDYEVVADKSGLRWPRYMRYELRACPFSGGRHREPLARQMRLSIKAGHANACGCIRVVAEETRDFSMTAQVNQPD